MLLVATPPNYKPIMQFNWGSCKKKKLYQFFLFLLYYWILNGGGVETDLPIPRGPLEELQFSALLLQLDYLFLEVTTCLQLLLLLLEPLFSFYKFFLTFFYLFFESPASQPRFGNTACFSEEKRKNAIYILSSVFRWFSVFWGVSRSLWNYKQASGHRLEGETGTRQRSQNKQTHPLWLSAYFSITLLLIGSF